MTTAIYARWNSCRILLLSSAKTGFLSPDQENLGRWTHWRWVEQDFSWRKEGEKKTITKWDGVLLAGPPPHRLNPASPYRNWRGQASRLPARGSTLFFQCACGHAQKRPWAGRGAFTKASNVNTGGWVGDSPWIPY